MRCATVGVVDASLEGPVWVADSVAMRAGGAAGGVVTLAALFAAVLRDLDGTFFDDILLLFRERTVVNSPSSGDVGSEELSSYSEELLSDRETSISIAVGGIGFEGGRTTVETAVAVGPGIGNTDDAGEEMG